MNRFSTVLLGAAALLVLAWGALPYLPGQIDDAYIVFAYAHRMVEQGEIAWNTGVRVEGYSSFVHLCLMAAGAVVGLDLALFSRVLSFLAAATLIIWLCRPRFGSGRGALALAVAAWQPFQHWATAGLETSLAVLLGTAGWVLTLGSRPAWAAGCVLLALFSLTRPEGAAWLALALCRRAALPRGFGGPERVVLTSLLALGGYHIARVDYFGALLPTPYLVKIAAVDSWLSGVREAAPELLSACAILMVVMSLRRGLSIWVLAPLFVQVALLVRAGGDWMGHARFVLPGVVAVAAAVFATGQPRTPPRWAIPLISGGLLLSFFWEPSRMEHAGPGMRNTWFLTRPGLALQTAWDVPLLNETKFLINHVPSSAGAFISDVGLPGNLEDVRIWDAAGLTDRVVAEVIAAQDAHMPPELEARYADDDDVWCVRYGLAGTVDTAPGWMVQAFPAQFPSPVPGMVWRCRGGGEPGQDVVVSRWQRLLERFPSQDWIRWHYARAVWMAGRPDEALRIGKEARWLGDEALGWLAFEGAGYNYSAARGWPLYSNATLTSLPGTPPFWSGVRVRLIADDPGEEGAIARIRWEGGCDGEVTVAVHEPVVAAPPPCEAPGARRLSVEFLNDGASNGQDRNLWVSLTAYSGTGTMVTPPAPGEPPE